MGLKIAYALAIGLAAVSFEAAHALALSECARTTHISHAGEDMHRDLGDGRVMWREWWSQEGTYSDYMIMDCGQGQALRFRTAEEHIGDRLPFDRTEEALRIVSIHERGARVFATFERMAEDLTKEARDVTIVTLKHETCACAARYAGLRGDKAAFDLDATTVKKDVGQLGATEESDG